MNEYPITIVLNNEEFDLFESVVTDKVQYFHDYLGGRHFLHINEQNLTDTMFWLRDKDEYKSLKDKLQKEGEEKLGW